MTDKNTLKIIFIISLITGGITGVLQLIPAFIWVTSLILMFLPGPVTVLYLNRQNLSEISNTEKTVVISAISGAFSVLGFCLTYLPVAFILYLIFKIPSFLWVKVIFNNFGFIIPMIIFSGLLSALLNSFSGFLTVYFYNILFGNKRG